MNPSDLTKKLRERVIHNFMDILVLTEMRSGSLLSGYDVIALLHRKFGMLLSSGTVYSLLYSLEREGLIKGVWNQRKRVYQLTEEGEQNIQIIEKANNEIRDFLRNITLLNTTRQ